MVAFSTTEVNFLRLLKACEMGLLKQAGGSESMSRETVCRYTQYVRVLCSYAEELQRTAEAASIDSGAAAHNMDASGTQGSKRMPRCSLSADEMAQHQQKVLLIEDALQRARLHVDSCGDMSGPSSVQALTDKSALTTVARKSVVRPDAMASTRARNSNATSGRTRHRRSAGSVCGNDKRTTEALGAPKTADEVDSQDELQDQLAGDLLAMTRQFKQQQLELRSQAQDDQQVLSRTDELISSNGEQIRTRVSALQKLEGAVGGWQTCKTICLLLVCVGIFTVTFVFMRVVGKRG